MSMEPEYIILMLWMQFSEKEYDDGNITRHHRWLSALEHAYEYLLEHGLIDENGNPK